MAKRTKSKGKKGKVHVKYTTSTGKKVDFYAKKKKTMSVEQIQKSTDYSAAQKRVMLFMKKFGRPGTKTEIANMQARGSVTSRMQKKTSKARKKRTKTRSKAIKKKKKAQSKNLKRLRKDLKKIRRKMASDKNKVATDKKRATKKTTKKAAVKVIPRCSVGLRITTRIAATATGATRKTWKRTWQVNNAPRSICTLPGNR